MAFLAKCRQVDLTTLAIELGIEVISTDRFIEIYKKIKNSPDFEEGLVKNMLDVIVKEREVLEERAFELEKLRTVAAGKMKSVKSKQLNTQMLNSPNAGGQSAIREASKSVESSRTPGKDIDLTEIHHLPVTATNVGTFVDRFEALKTPFEGSVCPTALNAEITNEERNLVSKTERDVIKPANLINIALNADKLSRDKKESYHFPATAVFRVNGLARSNESFIRQENLTEMKDESSKHDFVPKHLTRADEFEETMDYCGEVNGPQVRNMVPLKIVLYDLNARPNENKKNETVVIKADKSHDSIMEILDSDHSDSTLAVEREVVRETIVGRVEIVSKGKKLSLSGKLNVSSPEPLKCKSVEVFPGFMKPNSLTGDKLECNANSNEKLENEFCKLRKGEFLKVGLCTTWEVKRLLFRLVIENHSSRGFSPTCVIDIKLFNDLRMEMVYTQIECQNLINHAYNVQRVLSYIQNYLAKLIMSLLADINIKSLDNCLNWKRLETWLC